MQFILLTSTDGEHEGEAADRRDSDSGLCRLPFARLSDEPTQVERPRDPSAVDGTAFPIRSVNPKFIAALTLANSCKSPRLRPQSERKEPSLISRNPHPTVQSDSSDSIYLHMLGDWYSTFTGEDESLQSSVPEETQSPQNMLEGPKRRRLSSPVCLGKPSAQRVALFQPNPSRQFASAQQIRISPKVRE